MKQVIVMVAAILLGVHLFGLIAGPGEGSIRSTVGSLWQQEITMRTAEP
ncbi:MAG: hypothetical protein J6E42_08270 [Firmicutes bacterium]|nr:hypothetical protein [Bacillota bacterium]